MKFCGKCGSLMMPTKKDGQTVMKCNSCGNIESGDMKLSEKGKKEKEVEVIEKQVDTRAIAKEECPKCGNKEAWYEIRQTRAADEPPTRFLQCTKCKHNWREYD